MSSSGMKRKRQAALYNVCEKLTGMTVRDSRGRDTTNRRSKSILKKTHIGCRVRFERKGTLQELVMFDEHNIHELQLCLHPSPGQVPTTPRSVLLIQQDTGEEVVSELSSLSSPTTQAQVPLPTTRDTPPTTFCEHQFVYDYDDLMDDDPNPDHDRTFFAKRGRIRQHEIEEGRRFREILSRAATSDDTSDTGGDADDSHASATFAAAASNLSETSPHLTSPPPQGGSPPPHSVCTPVLIS